MSKDKQHKELSVSITFKYCELYSNEKGLGFRSVFVKRLNFILKKVLEIDLNSDGKKSFAG